MGQITFVTGGARSGKSAFAEQIAAATGQPVTYIATLEPLDAEMRDRIARHREQRPTAWQTIEAPRDVAAACGAAPNDTTILLDCLSLWVSNRLLALGDEPSLEGVRSLEQALDAEIDQLIVLAHERHGALVVVSNEVGSGVVPPSALGRAYRDVLGRANQRVSLAADRAWLLVAGRALELPSPEGR